jgi:hypothetical protein
MVPDYMVHPCAPENGKAGVWGVSSLRNGGAGLRTPDTRIMIPLLWPAELHRHRAYHGMSRELFVEGLHPSTLFQLPKIHERLVGRKIANTKKAVRIKNSTW